MNRIWFPLQRAIRTFLQVLAASLLFLGAALAGFAVLAPQLLEAIREILPPDWYAWAVAAIAIVAAVSGALARVMAIPAVDRWLRKWGAGSAPRTAVLDTSSTPERPLSRREQKANPALPRRHI